MINTDIAIFSSGHETID